MSNETYQTRIWQLKRRVDLTIWIGAGFGGAIALTTGDAFNEGHPICKSITVALIIIGSACLGYARVSFEWILTNFNRRIEKGELLESWPLSVVDHPFPYWPEKFWTVSLCFLFFSGLFIIITFISAIFYPKSSSSIPSQPKKPHVSVACKKGFQNIHLIQT